MAESNFTTPEQKNAADRSSGSASEKLEPSLNTLQGETAQTQQNRLFLYVRKRRLPPRGLVRCFGLLERPKAFLWAIWPYSAVLP